MEMRRFVVVSAALLWSAAAAFAAEPSGTYRIEGANPGGKGQYKGTVSVTKTGETYQVVWVVGSTRYVGTGIGNKDFLAVSYKSGNDTGLALYGADGGNWSGVWTYAGGKEVGPEIWKRN
jgi:hypothetical protein